MPRGCLDRPGKGCPPVSTARRPMAQLPTLSGQGRGPAHSLPPLSAARTVEAALARRRPGAWLSALSPSVAAPEAARARCGLAVVNHEETPCLTTIGNRASSLSS